MNRNSIKDALDRIVPPSGAEQRMYENILKKYEAPKKSPVVFPGFRLLAPIAACLVLILCLGFFLRPQENPRPTGMVSTGSPMAAVDSPADFSPAGVYFEAPEGAQQIACHLLRQQVARMDFTLEGVPYVFLASGLREDDFSGVSEIDGHTETVLRLPQITLTRIDGKIWKASVALPEIRGYVLNHTGADQAQMTELAEYFASVLTAAK